MAKTGTGGNIKESKLEKTMSEELAERDYAKAEIRGAGITGIATGLFGGLTILGMYKGGASGYAAAAGSFLGMCLTGYITFDTINRIIKDYIDDYSINKRSKV